MEQEPSGSQAINTKMAPPTADFLLKVYGIDANTAGMIESAEVNEKGNLVKITTEQGATGVKSSYAPEKGLVTNVSIQSVNVTPAGGAAVVNLTVGPHTVGGTAPTDDELLALYGLNVAQEQVKEFTVNADGTITVTKKDVNNAANLLYDTANGNFASIGGNGQGIITLGLNTAHPKFNNINIDFSTSSNVNNNGSSTISASRGTQAGLGAGRKTGEMINISVAKDGVITASYDNGMSRCLGQIATAVFANPSGLEKQGDNLYSATMNSGEFNGTGVDITADGGYMQSGVLEMSNVDLSQEFTEMITTQRGFQANSRIITVSDTMLEELTNLKR